jgi:hypothetical protein
VETVTVTLELPVSASLSSYVRALEAARDAQTDPEAKQAVAAVAALASNRLRARKGHVDRCVAAGSLRRPTACLCRKGRDRQTQAIPDEASCPA